VGKALILKLSAQGSLCLADDPPGKCMGSTCDETSKYASTSRSQVRCEIGLLFLGLFGEPMG
jgi:hypothetical protein